ncbi:hypothetical protein ACXAT3_002663 [Clostridium sporogenes]
MGNEKIKHEQNYVIDFLYKDMSLINSFYSQYFNGTLSNIVKKEMACDETGQEGSVGLKGLFGGKISSNESINKAIESNINPLDALIIELISVLNLNTFEDNLCEIRESGIYKIEGNIMFRDYSIINDLVPIISETNLVPEFNKPLNPNSKGKERRNTIGNMIEKLISVMPFGLEFEVVTKNKEHLTAIIKEEFLTIKSSDLIRMYGLTLPDDWTIIGILDKASSNQLESNSKFKTSIDAVIQVYNELIDESSYGYTIRPIVIYRKVKCN